MKSKSLLQSFTILSFVAFFITGIVLVLFLNEHMKSDKIESVEKTVHITLHYVLESYLPLDEIKQEFGEEYKMKLNSKFNMLLTDNTLIGIKILNNNNEVVYSLSNESMQEYFNKNNKLKNVADSKKNYHIIELPLNKEVSSRKQQSKILVAYLPITINNTIVGTYEVYKAYDEIEKHTREVIYKVSAIVFSGLMILYLLLIRIVKDNSKTLLVQNDILLKNKIELQEAYNKLNSTYKDTIEALSSAIDARDPYTAGHSKRVSEISLKIGKELGLNNERLELLELSALFHDIGKLGIKDNVLLKTDKLTNEEFNIIRQHPDLGVKIISNIEFLGKTKDIIKYHHERFNGGGYPKGISGEAIPLESRIIAVADSYDAMTSDRPYRKGMPLSVAVSELIRNQNTQFDEKVVKAFLTTYDDKNKFRKII